MDDGSFVTRTYVFDDIVRALNSVQPYDWATFLRARLDGHGPGAPLDGITRGGYKLVYTDTPSDYFKLSEANRKSIARVMVAPMPTAAPLIAAITGFLQS